MQEHRNNSTCHAHKAGPRRCCIERKLPTGQSAERGRCIAQGPAPLTWLRSSLLAIMIWYVAARQSGMYMKGSAVCGPRKHA